MAARAHQRRLIAAALAFFCTDGADGGCKRRFPDFSWETHVHRMYDHEFKLRYRVSPESFYKLLDILKPELDVTNHQQGFFSHSGKVIQLEVRLAVASLNLSIIAGSTHCLLSQLALILRVFANGLLTRFLSALRFSTMWTALLI